MSKESKTSKKSRSKCESKLSDEDLQICNFDNICEAEKVNDSKHILIPNWVVRQW